MSIRLTGQLLSPTDGSPAANGQIRFISLQGTGKVPKGAIAIEAADVNGDYDFTLEFGRFSVEIRQADKFVKQGAVSVNADTPTPLEVGELLEYTEPLTPGQITYVEQLTAQAEAAAQAANVSQSAANSSAMAASNSAAEAKSEADRATEITGLDTVEEAIDLTLAKTLGLMTETEAKAQADAYEQVFAASGMAHMGKAYGSSPAEVTNEGMWSLTNSTVYSNKVMFGWHTNAGLVGVSEKNFPMTYIAGALANIYNLDPAVSSWNNTGNSSFIFPQAEAGTRVYDSTGDVRGSGQATLDFRYDNDPKYGGAPSGTEAEILREAVGRAFEGYTKNGDMRNGTTSWTAQGGATLTALSDGVELATSSSSMGMTGILAPATFGAGDTVDVTLVANIPNGLTYVFGTYDSVNGTQTVAVTGTGEVEVYKTTVTFASAASGVNIRLYHAGGSSSRTVTVHNLSLRPTTEEVVTHRSDVATWESYDEELTGRKEIMECVQFVSSTFGTTDVPTVLSTRPLSYFQQYDGQFADPDIQNDRYRCVVWDDLTDEQKRKVAAYMGNKLYVGENGNLVNRRLRARTFRGFGNGDWENIDSANPTNGYLRYGGNAYVKPQGSGDKPVSGTLSTGGIYSTRRGVWGKNFASISKGIFTAVDSYEDANGMPSISYKGRCFLYVVASVPRANQGAYVKGLNEYGTKTLNSNEARGVGRQWYESAAIVINTLAQCFHQINAAGDTTTPGAAISTGNIGTTSGHPDGIFYDGITAGGLNGVIDWRLPAEANDTPEEQVKVQGKVENKTFRGLEKLVWSKVIASTATSSYGTSRGMQLPIGHDVKVGDIMHFLGDTGALIKSLTITDVGIDFANWSASEYTYSRVAGVEYVGVNESKLNLSVSGEFNTSMVIGNPANLIQVDALKDGWLGTWCDVIPPSSGVFEYPLTRKALDSTVVWLSTVNFGGTWSSWSNPLNTTTNVLSTGNASDTNAVAIVPYTAYAKVTEPCENKAVYNGKKGLMPVFASSYHQDVTGALLAESLLGKVLKSSVRTGFRNYEVESFALNGGLIWGDGLELPVHSPISLAAPNNDSPAVKVLPYQIAENEQCFIGYQANELGWDADYGDEVYSFDCLSTGAVGNTGQVYVCNSGMLAGVCFISGYSGGIDLRDAYLSNGQIVARTTGLPITYLIVRPLPSGWGDDGKIKVTADGSDTFVDLNGNTNLSVSHKTTMPTGWTKNRARIGEQVEGVDL